MYRLLQKISMAFVAMLLFTNQGSAAPGDTTFVHVFQDEVVVTNPGTGSNKYHQWGEFPNPATTYNKVLMYLTFQCPDNLICAEWDYLDPISIRRHNGVNGDTLNWEFARFITPYGLYWGAGSSFKHGWYYDVTDFSTLLHDSVEIEYNHTGYEGTNRGWKINMTFMFIEGTPEREVLDITRIYSGGYAYNSNIETQLNMVSHTFGANTSEARLKIIQSGHGMDDQNCSEFCPKQRYVKYDGTTIDQRLMWRECGFNSLFPQAGTWLFDRGNWCPGASVKYDDIELPNVTAGTAHQLDIDMEAVGAGAYGNQVISAYVIEYGAPNYTTDVSLEAIISPSNEFESSRVNPICGEPVIVIKNSGTDPLTSLNVVYGVPGGVQSTFQWTGNLPFLGVDTVRITQAVNWAPNSNVFQVSLQDPNGGTDENEHNNFSLSPFTAPPVYNATSAYIEFKTNNAPSENHYELMDISTGTVVLSKPNFASPNTTYRDTFEMIAGHCYQLAFYDDGPPLAGTGLNNDGLIDWWWTGPGGATDGNGLIAMKRTQSGFTYKNFETDFGTKFYYQFQCLFPLDINEVQNDMISMIVSPNPSPNGDFNIDYTMPEKNSKLEVYNMVGMKVYSETLKNEVGQTSLSLKELPKGVYLIKVITPGNLVHTQRIISR